MNPSPWYVILGPTGVGKTAAAIHAACSLDAEILSADSAQVYRGMDIGTSKPGRRDRVAVAHHLIDCVDPLQGFSVAEYVRLARKASHAIESGGKRVLIVGGTGLYLRALLEGLFNGPPASRTVRARLLEEAETFGPELLRSRLCRIDPEAAGKIGSRDVRRLVRALEVFELTGRPISAHQTQWNGPGRPVVIAGLRREREDLYRRIEKRVDRMVQEGLFQEVKTLLDAGVSPGSTAMQAIGYREISECFVGQRTRSEAIRLIKRNTRRLAKRQMTWFRGMKDIHWLSVARAEQASFTAKRLVDLFERYSS